MKLTSRARLLAVCALAATLAGNLLAQVGGSGGSATGGMAPKPPAGPPVGKPISIKFNSVDGRPVDLASMKGKVVLVDFWATWCGPCVGEIPNVKAAYEKLHAKGFEIIGISFDKDRTSLLTFVSKHKMPWPQYFDGLGWGNNFGKQFGINSIPRMWLIDKKGNLRETNARENLAKKVETLLAE